VPCGVLGDVDSPDRPNGAAECSHGWSDAAFGVAQPVGVFIFQYIRPDGAAESRRRRDEREKGPVGSWPFF
jgi:hypothetical protein